MTAFAPPHPPSMDLPVLDEKMDTASSPFQQVEFEDLDLEFDQMENQNLLPPSDNPMDDAFDFGSKIDEAMQGDGVELLEDANMQDNEHVEIAHVEKDFDMGEEATGNQNQEDEILYDDEEDDTAVADTAIQQEAIQSEQNNPEEDLFDFDDTDHIDISTIEQQQKPEPTKTDTENLDTAPHQAQTSIQIGGENLLDESSTPIFERQPSSEDTQPPQDATESAQEQHIGQEDELEFYHDHLDDEALTEAHNKQAQEHIDYAEGGELLLEEPQAESDAATSIDISSLAPHFVMLKFNEVYYPLFSDEENAGDQPFPLSDTSLIFEPLDKLLEACRERVFNSDQDHLDEVDLNVPSLELHYRQDSKYTSQRSLADILQVYVMLKQNEKAESIEPLNCTLAIQTCLATQYSWLVEEAAKKTPYLNVACVETDAVPAEGNVQAREEHVEAGGTSDPEDASLQQKDAVQAELDAEATGVASGEAFEQAYDQSAENGDQAQSGETLQASTSGVDDQALGEGEPADEAHVVAVDNTGEERAGEHAEQAGQTSEFFEDAFEDEDAANEAEHAEEVLEQEEDRHALEEAQEHFGIGEGHESHEQVEDQEQLDFGDEPEPFKQVEEEKEIALEEEDLFLNPNDPLEADEDPDALLEGRAANTALAAEASEAASDPAPVNGNHLTNGSASAPQPNTPAKLRSSKRKVEDDEDDFLDLDFDTPEPKRHRHSPP